MRSLRTIKMSYREIAKHLGISPGREILRVSQSGQRKVKVRIARALAATVVMPTVNFASIADRESLRNLALTLITYCFSMI